MATLELRTAYGSVYRDVLDTPPRNATDEEIPVIDISRIWSDKLSDRKAVANQVRDVGVGTGFFYVKNHGIPEEIIQNAKKQTLAFFHQPLEEKMKVSKSMSKYFNGYGGFQSTLVNNQEKFDCREAFAWRYEPKYDPDHPQNFDEIPEEVKPWIHGEDFVWENTSHLVGFKEDILAYWTACLILARKLVQTFALSLDLDETYFDSRTTYPGADGALNYYPVASAREIEDDSIGLGSHTDLQLFTLLWQDDNGGLQVLNKDGQWIKAPPVPNTFVVNIGDFMMRLSNDIFKSTVHRVFNRSLVERISMPFFFGLNFNCVEGVIPTCVSDENPAKYESICCGEWAQLRFKNADRDLKRVRLEEKEKAMAAPSAKVVEVS